MRFNAIDLVWTSMVVCSVFARCGIAEGAEAPPIKLALSFRPIQKDVEYDTPKTSEYSQCQVKVEQKGKTSGWVVFGPSGQVLRRFIDTNSDNVVDQWKYYHHGLEVYRDIDRNFNNKVDESRWLNTGGSRWGLDTNEDGQIDVWKVISAEEASREAVRAMVMHNVRGLEAVLINADDVKKLGLDAEISRKLLESVASPKKKLKMVLSKSKSISGQTRWMRFDSSTPGTIPADEKKATADLTVYANAMAIVETKGKATLLQIGEMIRVDQAWKLTQIPQPLEGDSVEVMAGGILMQPGLAASTTADAGLGSLSLEMQALLEQLQKLDKNSPATNADGTVLGRYHAQRADLLNKLIKISTTDEERSQWFRQMVDGITAAVQTGTLSDGLERLNAIESDVRKSKPKSPMVAYVSYRRLLAQYSNDLQHSSNEKQHEVQQDWLKQLEEFSTAFPNAEDVPEAQFQLARALEFSGKNNQARKWYGTLIRDHAESTSGIRAAGAVRRLGMKGKPLNLSGPGLRGGRIDSNQFQGKVLLVLYWSTWCKPCTEDLPQILALYKQHHRRGFEILGVNVDTTTAPVGQYLSQHGITWPQLHQPGGLMESKPATDFGVILLPTMFLTDRQGTVVNNNVLVDELKDLVPELLKKR
jgi:thiol-disulfide isomerase/thioredoxin